MNVDPSVDIAELLFSQHEKNNGHRRRQSKREMQVTAKFKAEFQTYDTNKNNIKKKIKESLKAGKLTTSSGIMAKVNSVSILSGNLKKDQIKIIDIIFLSSKKLQVYILICRNTFLNKYCLIPYSDIAYFCIFLWTKNM